MADERIDPEAMEAGRQCQRIATGGIGFEPEDFAPGYWESKVLLFAQAITAAYAQRIAAYERIIALVSADHLCCNAAEFNDYRKALDAALAVLDELEKRREQPAG